MSFSAWLRKPVQSLYTNTKFNSKMILDSVGVRKLAEYLIDPTFISALTIADAKDWLSSLIFYPFKIVGDEDKYLSGEQIIVGKLQVEDYITNIPATIFNNIGYYHLGEIRYNRYYNNFMDFYPYTKVEMFLPFLGNIELNPNDLIDKYIQIRLQVDFNTGQGVYIVGVNDESIPFSTDPLGNYTPYITDYEKEKTIRIIGTYTCQIGIPIPLGSSNQADNIRNLTYGTIKAVANIGATIAFAKMGADKTVTRKTGTFTTKAKIDSGRLKTIEKTKLDITSETTQPYKALTKSISETINAATDSLNYFTSKGNCDRPNSSNIMMCTSNSARLVIYRPNVVNLGSGYAHLYGHPLGEVKKLSTLGGYTKISEVHTENIPALNSELVDIETALYDGVIL